MVVNVHFKNSAEVHAATKGLLKNFLERTGITDEIHVSLEQQKGTSACQGVSVRRLHGRVAHVRVQPKGNDTCYLAMLTAPEGQDPEHFFSLLKTAEMIMSEGRYEKKMRKIFSKLGGKDFSLQDISEEVISGCYKNKESFGAMVRYLIKIGKVLVAGPGRGEYRWTEEFKKEVADMDVVREDESSVVSGQPVGCEAETSTELVEEETILLADMYRITGRKKEVETEKQELQRQFDALNNEHQSIKSEMETLGDRLNRISSDLEKNKRRFRELASEEKCLVDEEATINQRVEELEKDKRIAAAVAKANEAFVGMNPEDVKEVLLRLSQSK